MKIISWLHLTQKIAKLRRSCDSFCVHKLQETTFVCNIAIDKFCLHYCILQLFFVQQLSTFLCIILIANVFYWLLQLRSIVWAVAFKNFCMHYCNFWLTMFNRYLICTIEFDKLFAPLKFETPIFTIVFMTRLYSIHCNNCQVLIMYYVVHI